MENFLIELVVQNTKTSDSQFFELEMKNNLDKHGWLFSF